MLAHVELVELEFAFLEAGGEQRGARHADIGRAGGGHDLLALEVGQRLDFEALADDELFHLVFGVLAVDRDVHGDAGLLEIGVHAFDRHQHRRGVDLIADHRRDVGRAADQPGGFDLDVLILEEALLDADEQRQR